MGTATLFALFMPTFAAVLARFEWVVIGATVRRLVGMAATVPFTEKWTGWDLSPKRLRDGSACLLLIRKEVQDSPGPPDGDCAHPFQVQEIFVAGDKAVDPRNEGRSSQWCVLRISDSVPPGVDL